MISPRTPFPYRVKSPSSRLENGERVGGRKGKYIRGSCLLMAKRFIAGTVNAGVGL